MVTCLSMVIPYIYATALSCRVSPFTCAASVFFRSPCKLAGQFCKLVFAFCQRTFGISSPFSLYPHIFGPPPHVLLKLAYIHVALVYQKTGAGSENRTRVYCLGNESGVGPRFIGTDFLCRIRESNSCPNLG